MPHSTKTGYRPSPRNPLPIEVITELIPLQVSALTAADNFEEEYPRDTRLHRWVVDGEEAMYNVTSLSKATLNGSYFKLVRLLTLCTENEDAIVVRDFLGTVMQKIKESEK